MGKLKLKLKHPAPSTTATAINPSNPPTGGKQQERTCCGVIQDAKFQAREKREHRQGPQPWIVLKLMVGITLGILVYAAYVYIGRFCAGMITRGRGALGGRAMGIVFLIVFVLLLLMTLWAYVKVVVTPPGQAKDHIPHSSQPLIPPRHPQDSWHSDALDAEMGINPHHRPFPDDTISGPAYELMNPPHTTVDLSRHQSHSETPPTPQSTVRSPVYSQGQGQGSQRPKAQSHRSHRSHTSEKSPKPTTHKSSRRPSAPQSHEDANAGVLDSIPTPSHSHPPTTASTASSPHVPTNVSHNTQNGSNNPHSIANPSTNFNPTVTVSPATNYPRSRDEDLPPPMYSRYPPTTPILLPEYRYCPRDQLVKPYRAHHCRSCGTCILKYDHHCPWIGQCVGARNQKFFVNFLQWSSIFCMWTFATLLGLNVRASEGNLDFSIDPQEVVIIAMSGLFTLFTVMLLASHIRLILLNQTTVESVGMQTMKEREGRVLSRMHGFWELRARYRTRKQWDDEWGRIGIEGNLWWASGARGHWEEVMGRHVWEWILPVGRSLGDGLTYPTNPRFDEQGRWRRRKEWPKELQRR